jgi:hypothetical protein
LGKTASQKRQVFCEINSKDQHQHGLVLVWVRQIIAKLTADKFGIERTFASVGKLLAALTRRQSR